MWRCWVAGSCGEGDSARSAWARDAECECECSSWLWVCGQCERRTRTLWPFCLSWLTARLLRRSQASLQWTRLLRQHIQRTYVSVRCWNTVLTQLLQLRSVPLAGAGSRSSRELPTMYTPKQHFYLGPNLPIIYAIRRLFRLRPFVSAKAATSSSVCTWVLLIQPLLFDHPYVWNPKHNIYPPLPSLYPPSLNMVCES